MGHRTRSFHDTAHPSRFPARLPSITTSPQPARTAGVQSRLTILQDNFFVARHAFGVLWKGSERFGRFLPVRNDIWQIAHKMLPHGRISRPNHHHRGNKDYDKRYEDKQQNHHLFSAQRQHAGYSFRSREGLNPLQPSHFLSLPRSVPVLRGSMRRFFLEFMDVDALNSLDVARMM